MCINKRKPCPLHMYRPRVPYCKEAVIKSESIPPLQHLQAIVQHHMPACGLDWRSTPLYDVPTKSKVTFNDIHLLWEQLAVELFGSLLDHFLTHKTDVLSVTTVTMCVVLLWCPLPSMCATWRSRPHRIMMSSSKLQGLTLWFCHAL